MCFLCQRLDLDYTQSLVFELVIYEALLTISLRCIIKDEVIFCTLFKKTCYLIHTYILFGYKFIGILTNLKLMGNITNVRH